MPKDLEAIRRYLAPPHTSHWTWSDDAEVITWKNGRTVVFRKELEQILHRLAPGGLPPLGAIVFLLAACRDRWQNTSWELGTIAGMLSNVEKKGTPKWVPQVFTQLDRVHALPAELRTSVEAKCLLAEVVFETSTNRLSRALSHDVIETLEAGPYQDLITRQGRSAETLSDYIAQLRSLHEGLWKIDADGLELRRRTGLDQLVVAPEEIEDEPAQELRSLIAQLHEDRELGGLARVARHLLATVSLPRPMDRHEDLPLGGVSDITNRGSLDKLLLSELAHDDTTLAVRVAVNEAMYLRRESPPHNPPRCRTVLIDSGIRMWGVPRIFATATALALAASVDKDGQATAFRAAGSAIEQVDLATRSGLVEHLEALHPAPHPGDAIPALLTEIDKLDEAADLVIITGEDVLADREFQQAIESIRLPSWYLVTVDRTGRFTLQQRSGRGGKTLQRAELELDKLLAPREAQTTPLIDKSKEGLPAIFSIEPFPLWLSHPLNARLAWSAQAYGVLAITSDRRLMHWQQQGRGATQLATNMPGGALLWASPVTLNATSHAIVGRKQQGEASFLTIDLNGGSCETTPLDVATAQIVGVHSVGSFAFLIYVDHVEVFSTSDGLRLFSQVIPHNVTHVDGSYFKGDRLGNWLKLGYDGLTVRLEEVPLDGLPDDETLSTLFDRPGFPAPVGFTNKGNLFFTEDGRLEKIEHWVRGPIIIQAVSRDGSRVVVSQEARIARQPERVSVVDVATGTSERMRKMLGKGGMTLLAEADLEKTIYERTQRHRFSYAFVDGKDRLTLVSRRGNKVCFKLKHKQFLFRTPRPVGALGRPAVNDRRKTHFREIDTPEDVGFSIRVATWPDGSKAFLDSRGLLHLKSSDPSVPEVSLVLREGTVSGWCADGRRWGQPYFVGETDLADPTAIYNDAILPFVRQLQC